MNQYLYVQTVLNISRYYYILLLKIMSILNMYNNIWHKELFMSEYYDYDDDWYYDEEKNKNKNAWWDTTMFDNETDYLNWYNSIYSNDD